MIPPKQKRRKIRTYDNSANLHLRECDSDCNANPQAKSIAKQDAVLTGLRKQIESEYERLQSISTEIDRHGKTIHLKIGLDEIDIDRVKDAETRNYLAFRKLIKDFNPN